jgi:hypothetical protein
VNEGSRARADVARSRIISDFKRGRHRIARGGTDVPQMGCDFACRAHAAASGREPGGRRATESVVGTQWTHCCNRRRPVGQRHEA